MKDINKTWLKQNNSDFKIKELELTNKELLNISNTYKDVFNGPPFYENWDLESAYNVIKEYIEQNALILVFKYKERTIGFLVAINKVPENQTEYVTYKENIKYVEEIGVLDEFRGNGIASELVRILLLNYLKENDMYLCYRTNAIRYFDYNEEESFEEKVIRIIKEDNEKRLNNENIKVPVLTEEEKQRFINVYIKLLETRPDLDVSNSNALFRSIFGTLNFNSINGDYTFQQDPTGEFNDRIFPYVELNKIYKKEER